MSARKAGGAAIIRRKETKTGKRVLLTIWITAICLCSAGCSENGTAAPVESSAIPEVSETQPAAIEEEEVIAVQSAWTAKPLLTPEPTPEPTPVRR